MMLVILFRIAVLLIAAVLFGGAMLTVIACIFAGIVGDHSYGEDWDE